MELPKAHIANQTPRTAPRTLLNVSVALLVVASVFQAVSLFAITAKPGFSVGIAPYWIVALLSVLAMLPYTAAARRALAEWLPRDLRISAIFLAAFVIYGAISAFVLPFAFEGAQVLDPRLGMNAQFMNPSALKWSPSNAGQAAYILLNLAVLGLLVLRVRSLNDLGIVYKMLLVVSFLVLAFGIFQHVSVAYAPNQIYEAAYKALHNNPGTRPYPVTDPRTTSFFLEPSFFAGFAVSLFAMGMTGYLFAGSGTSFILSLAALYGLLASESTLGMLLLVMALILVGGLVVLRVRSTHGAEMDRQPMRRAPGLLLALVCVLVVYWQEPALVTLLRAERAQVPAVGSVPTAAPPAPNAAGTPPAAVMPTAAPEAAPPVEVMPVSPAPRPFADRLLSMKFRLWADQFSMFSVTRETLFLGAGLGSNRPSSFLSYLISNMGIPGLIAFAGFALMLIRGFIKRIAGLEPVALAIGMGLFSYLLSMIGGLPDPSWPPFLWIFSGLTFAALTVSTKSGPRGP